MGGAVLMIFLGELSGYLYKAKKHAALTEVIGETEKYVKGFQEMAMGFMNESPIYVLQQASNFLKYTGNLIMAWLLGEQAMIAYDKLNALFAAKGAATKAAQKALIKENPEAMYYDSKVKTAIFFHKQLLPENEFLKNVIQCGDNTMMEIEL